MDSHFSSTNATILSLRLLSIPLNGFRFGRGSRVYLLWVTFNSIEWIRAVREALDLQEGDYVAFNSIEWILKAQ